MKISNIKEPYLDVLLQRTPTMGIGHVRYEKKSKSLLAYAMEPCQYLCRTEALAMKAATRNHTRDVEQFLGPFQNTGQHIDMLTNIVKCAYHYNNFDLIRVVMKHLDKQSTGVVVSVLHWLLIADYHKAEEILAEFGYAREV
jgi:hypothetical protein